MPLTEIKDSNILLSNQAFFYQTVKIKQEAYEKLVEISKMMTIQQETY